MAALYVWYQSGAVPAVQSAAERYCSAPERGNCIQNKTAIMGGVLAEYY